MAPLTGGDAPQALALTSADAGDDSGVDLRLAADLTLGPRELRLVGLGVRAALYRGDEPRAFFLLPRSSTPSKWGLMLANSVGLIDRGYRGELKAQLWNMRDEEVTVPAGTALLQLVSGSLDPVQVAVVAHDAEVISPAATDRGDRGIGSTGAAGQ